MNFRSPRRADEGMPPSRTLSRPQIMPARVGRRKAISSVAIVLIPAAPMAKSIVTPSASPAPRTAAGGVSSGSRAMKTMYTSGLR